MPPPLIFCTELRVKLTTYFQQKTSNENGVVPLSTRAELARALGVQDGQVKNWLDGRNNGREDRIPDWVLAWLTEQLVLVSKGRVDSEQAYDLWRNCSAREFERQLRDTPTSDFMVTLKKKSPSLTVNIGVAPGDLQMFGEPFEPLPGEKILMADQKLVVEVKARANRCLVVLASSPHSWYWMSPSDSHPGPTSGGAELVPQSRGFSLSVRGPHRVIAIELGTSSPPFKRERGEPMDLQPHMVKALTEEISACEQRGGWRWGEARFFYETHTSSTR